MIWKRMIINKDPTIIRNIMTSESFVVTKLKVTPKRERISDRVPLYFSSNCFRFISNGNIAINIKNAKY